MAASPLRHLPPESFDEDKARHLLNRAGFGGTPQQSTALANMGLAKAVDFIVDFQRVKFAAVDSDEFDRDIMRPATDEEQASVRAARRSGDEAALERLRQARVAAQSADRRQMAAIQRWWLARMIETPRPLEEKLTLFWHGHFATGYRKIEDSYHMFLQNRTLRDHAAGNFRDLVQAIITDPAMIRYLDNQANRRGNPNENLARELMELFTLGEGNDYTEDDIKEAARALTGYAYEDDEFIFRRGQHDGGTKTVLGTTGNFDGSGLVDVILSRPAASEFMTYKLYRFFVNDLPQGLDDESKAVMRKLAAELRRNQYELRPLLKAMFMSEHFYDPRNVAAQIKSPIQLIVQAIRSLRTPVRKLDTLLLAADLMGQNLFYPPTVKGWDGGRTWINTSTLFVRQNILVYLLTGRQPSAQPWDAGGEPYDAMPLVRGLRASGVGVEMPKDEASKRQLVVRLMKFNLGSEPHEDRVDEMMKYLESTGGEIDDESVVGLLSLMTAMPEYQLC